MDQRMRFVLRAVLNNAATALHEMNDAMSNGTGIAVDGIVGRAVTHQEIDAAREWVDRHKDPKPPDIVTILRDLPLMELYKVQGMVRDAIDREHEHLLDSVVAFNETALGRASYGVHLRHATYGTYWCQKVGSRGRWRVWKMVEGKRGLKRGPMVLRESMNSDLDNLKIQIALGHYKDS